MVWPLDAVDESSEGAADLGLLSSGSLAVVSVFCRSNALSAAIDLAFLAAFSICFARRPAGTPVKAMDFQCLVIHHEPKC